MNEPENIVDQANNYLHNRLKEMFSQVKRNEGGTYQEEFANSFKDPDFLAKLTANLYDPRGRRIIISLGKQGQAVVIGENTNMRFMRKVVLVIKVWREDSLCPDMDKNFLFVELSKSILEQMFIMCKEIFYPMLSQTVYQGEASELISKDLMEKFHNFLSHFEIALGHVKKETILPVPNDDFFKNTKINDNEKTQICEGAIVMWIELIKHILKQEPENDFRNPKTPNPGPLTEIEFWEKKSVNLQSILTQIDGNEIGEILKFLEKQKSSYYKFFNDIKKQVFLKSKEATQNYLFLKFLAEDFTELENDADELKNITPLFIPIFHVIRLIWKDNQYYAKSERLIVLIRKICNALIDQARSYVKKNIFDEIANPDDTYQAIDRMRKSKSIIKQFTDAYFSYKDNKTEGWKITRNVIFYRIDAFNDRIGDILSIAQSYYEFNKIQSRNVGGIKGEHLMNMLNQIFEECSTAIKTFNQENYDPLDISSDEFNIKFNKFKETVKELERKVAAVLTRAFDESETIIAKFKCLQNFEAILERPNIVIELEKKYNILLDIFKQELRVVQMLFLTGRDLIDEGSDKSPLDKGMPPIAAILYWTDSLKERIRGPYEHFLNIGKRITEKEEFKEIESLNNSISTLISEYEDKKRSSWNERSKHASGDKQKEFLLKKQGELLIINFDPELLQLLKEIKYLKILNLPIEPEAEAVYAKNATFKKQIANLENIVSSYNNILLTMNEVEKPLIEQKLKKINELMEPGISKITWENGDDIDAFIKKTNSNVNDLVAIVDKLKNFVNKIEHVLEEWQNKVLFKRPKEGETPDLFPTSINSQFKSLFDAEKDKMSNKSKDISNLNEVSAALKSAVTNISKFKESDKWKNYQDYVNYIIIRGITALILKNLEDLYRDLDPNLDYFFVIRLRLFGRTLGFEPPLEGDDPEDFENNVKGIMVNWINSFVNLASMVKNRVDNQQGGDYLMEVLENFRVQEVIYRLNEAINSMILECHGSTSQYADYKELWEKDFDEAFEDFLREYTTKPQEDEEQLERSEKIQKIFPNGNPILEDVVEYTPPKDVFDDRINEFKNKLKKIRGMEDNSKIRWVNVDYKIFKGELEEIIQKWIDKYKNFLKVNSTNKINNIKAFLEKVKQGLSKKPEKVETEEERKNFFSLLENIRDMNFLSWKIKEVIPNIKWELEILKKHSRSENDTEDLIELEEMERNSEEQKLMNETDKIAEDTEELIRSVEDVSQEINPLIERESREFKVEVRNFDEEVQQFRSKFVTELPRTLTAFDEETCHTAYKAMDEFYVHLLEMKARKKNLNEMEILLNLQVSQNKQIDDCLSDLKLYKTVWDYVSMMFYNFETWKRFKMVNVDADELGDKIDLMKAMMKNPVRKDLKTLPIFTELLKQVTNMDDIIQVIRTLKDRSIKARHWKHLMEITGKIIPYEDSDFSVETLINLEMFVFKEKCEDEKQIATEQEKMEIQYTKIEREWASEKFIMTRNLNNKEYDFFLFDHSQMEGIIENLEKHQNELIKMLQKKTILENFDDMEKRVEETFEMLKTINDVIKLWLKLQKNWEKLETIFMKSDDIQKTLREHYNKFKDLDLAFKDEMKQAYDYNTMNLVCTEERKRTLQGMSAIIQECEQALEEYLGEKKIIFPRFFFISNDTLLNMLSFGDYPNIINKNVKDCFDGIKTWIMKPVNDKNHSDTVLGMLSAFNGEVVNFEEVFVCTGLVEKYLLNFESKMRLTLKELLYKSRKCVEWSQTAQKPQGYQEKEPSKAIRRVDWLEPFPAQLALTVTQNVWTEEVEHAFEELEGGADGVMKEYLELSKKRIGDLIEKVKEIDLTRDLRAKIITIITVDVHARDVVEGFVEKKITDINNFGWKRQLKFRYNFDVQDVVIQIADYTTSYSYEYIGNSGRLVITPLTDRCYITLTQALNLMLGAAPAGPAGTGKTETTKDLGRNLGLGVIVQNCDKEMDIDTTARIFSGLSQTGFWGCFDEFNRITIEVLSVVSTQVKAVLDAQRDNAKMFNFEGNEIRLVPTVGFFITMNPGYAGRAELPENLKALFRSCAMVVPDLALICENMLMSEGFKDAKNISNKFITLYKLSKDLLSKQKHYDWGLRAIKSLLRQAGALKRHPMNASKPEDYIIMKALFDFNKAKIVSDDLPIFSRLLEDLFSQYAGDGKGIKEEEVNQELNEAIEETTEHINLLKDASFTLKTRQMYEILEVRHCMFVLGPPGCGKTSVWKTLYHTMERMLKRKHDVPLDDKKYDNIYSAYDKLSPKAITGAELLGEFDKNKSWRYGILSSIMKKMCKNDLPYKLSMELKWIILDGDIDPDWIESLNTVMDDNKVLTLNNGDRFPLDDYMRLIFEISNLRVATPATVSRGGVLYINDTDIGIKPFFEKWIKNRYSAENHEITRSIIQMLFKETFEKIMSDLRDRFVAPMVDIALVQAMCTIIQNLIEVNKSLIFDVDDDKKKLMVEGIYFYAFMWAIGGSLIDRKEINTTVKNAINGKLRIPDNGTCYDYFFDVKECAWKNWTTKLEKYEISEGELFHSIIVPNVEVIRMNKIIEINTFEEKPTLFIGDSGTGKTATCANFLKGIGNLKNSNGYQYSSYSINFNSFTNSYACQMIIESQIVQRFSNLWGPMGTMKLVYFLDDLNMPSLDVYFTQSHVELLRQILDYKEFFDRRDLEQKKILQDILFMGCQNPKAGSFTINLRLQRHFTVLSTSEPSEEIVHGIYQVILENHFKDFKLTTPEKMLQVIDDVIKASSGLLDKIRTDKAFTPNASKFHYQWNMREVAKVVEGVLRADPSIIKDLDTLYLLWYHECARIFKDRLKFVEDMKRYDELAFSVFDQAFKYEGLEKKADIEHPRVFVPFSETMDPEDSYSVHYPDFEKLKEFVQTRLEVHNEEVFKMPLVLFDDAVSHVCKIARICSKPNGHALLVGVGGSGKQSLSRLASFIKGFKVWQISLTGDEYNLESLREDFKNVIKQSCLKPSPQPCVFVLNDGNILDEYFLVYINNFLSGGWIDEMYETKTDRDADVAKIRSQAKDEGFIDSKNDSPEAIFEYLLYRIRINIHMVLCMSPVGDALRVRARKFPAILNNTSIDWFHEWPVDALEKVAFSFINEMEIIEESQAIKLSKVSASLHRSIKEVNSLYFAQERRYNYTTPKSFLELVNFFIKIVTEKDSAIENQIERLSKGLKILEVTGESIDELKGVIEKKSIEVEKEKAETNEVLAILEVKNKEISENEKIVSEASANAEKESAAAKIEKDKATEALDEAIPIKEKAEEDAQKIDPGKLNEFKSSKTPSKMAIEVFKLIYMIFFPKDKKAPDDVNQIKAKCLNQDANAIKTKLLSKLLDVSWIDDAFLGKMDKYLKEPFTDNEAMKKVSVAAAGVTNFFQNLVKYKEVIDKVEPLQEDARVAEEKSAKANAEKERLSGELKKIQDDAQITQDKFNEKNAAKEKVEKEQAELQAKLDLAEKFINLLAGNKIRWKEEVERLTEFRKRLAGDSIISSAFVSYTGVFNSAFREKLINQWNEAINLVEIEITPEIDIVHILIDEPTILKFKGEGLPADPFSIENAAIMNSCTRWPLIIDPQMQCIKWLKGMEGKKTAIQYKQPGWEGSMGDAINDGEILIIEDVDEELDPVLTPVLAKETKKVRGQDMIKIGSEDYTLNPKAKIYLVTKISNPHYKPEIIAQCTLINFIVTEKGLEDQLLAMVVNKEQPELEDQIKRYVQEINEFKSILIEKEDQVLQALETADTATILDNTPLINSLEQTKKSAEEIDATSKETEQLIKEINEKREAYRPVGEEGAMLFFLISKLFIVHKLYQYSLDSFTYFFIKAIDTCPKSENQAVRISSLREVIRINIYRWVTSGMFERDKQLFLTMIVVRLINKGAFAHKEELAGINRKHIDFLLKAIPKLDSPIKEKSLEWLDERIWQNMNALQELEGFADFAVKMEKEQSTKFREWFTEINPEEIPLPLEWKKHGKHSFQKILILRACRPDRVSIALNEFVRVYLNTEEIDFLSSSIFSDIFQQSFLDSNPEVPIFFILSPGSNPIKELQVLGKKVNPKKKYEINKNLWPISMGQKMDILAEQLLVSCNTDGHWLFLQNIHLMPNWLIKLQDKLKELGKEKGNEDFRLFLSAEPSNDIPVGILEKSIKLTNEPPSGLRENMKNAFNTVKNENPNIDDRRRCNVIFGLSYFHAVLLERKKFGSLGWNRNYPFNLDDLRNSDSVVAKYLEQNPGDKIPWDDLQYIIGEIMYGGHIVDDWDRRLCNSYLELLLQSKINEDLDLIPFPSNHSGMKLSFKTPANNPNFPFESWSKYIELYVVSESPALFGLHPNAELEYRITQAENLFQNLIDLEPKDGSAAADESEASGFERIKDKADNISSRAVDGVFNITSLINNSGEDRGPAQNVFIQECEQMRNLCELIKKNTQDIKDAIDGKLTMNEEIEKLIDALDTERVPTAWINEGFATSRKLTSWLISLELRINQLKIFENDQIIPKVVFINRLFNPLSYLTAIRQVFAQKNRSELDKLNILTEPTMIDMRQDLETLKFPKDAMLIYGLHLQGCRWDEENKHLDESRPREDYCVMPVINCKVADTSAMKLEENKSIYLCPVYKTIDRMSTYVFTAQFKTKLPSAKWIIAGVAGILDVEKTDSINKYPK